MDPALRNLLQYFEELERDDLDATVMCFTEDCVYHHPSYKGLFAGHEEDSDEWHRTVGRDELKALFELRGKQTVRHHVTAFARSGDLCFYELLAEKDGEPFSTTLAIFRVDETGRIAEYSPYPQLPPRELVGATPFTLDAPP